MLKLRVTPRSPFARKCMIVALEKGMFGKLELSATDLYGENQDIDEDNPLRKVPALRLEDGTTLFDSPVICEYLDWSDGDPIFHPQEGEMRFKALKLQALGDGLTEAPQSHYKELARPEKFRSEEMVMKHANAIDRIINWTEKNFDLVEGPMTIGGIALACGLAYVNERQPDTDWHYKNPKLGAWYCEISTRESFQETTKQANAKRLGVSNK